LKRTWWWILMLAAAGAGSIWWAVTRPKPVAVVIQTVMRGTVEKTVSNTRAGTVKACRRAKLSPSIGGQIATLGIHEGDTVKDGQVLMTLWNKDRVAEVTLAERESQAAAARADAACLEADISRREATRQVKLHASGAISAEQVDRAQTDAKIRQADCQAAQASARMSQARLGVARANLERTRLIAPFDGVIAQINGELNEYVTPSPPGIPTPPAVDIIDSSCFYVTAPIDEVDAPAITVGMPARIHIDAFGQRRFEGRVRRVASYVLDREKQARTVDVEVAFANPADLSVLLAGYSADAEIILKVHHDTLFVPTQAVVDGKRVWIYDPKSHRLKSRSVTIGIANWDHTEILIGVAEKEKVVVTVDRPGIADGALAVIEKAGS
jgi:HlyD family secretion protein